MSTAFLYLTDLNYLDMTNKSIESVEKFYPSSDIYVYHTIDHKIENVNRRIYINCQDLYQKYILDKVTNDKKRISQLKWCIPLFDIFYKYDNIIYLDSDTRMCSNIDDFINITTDKPVVGVSEFILYKYGHAEIRSVVSRLLRIFRSYGIRKTDYINNGVLLFKTGNITMDKAIVAYNNCLKFWNFNYKYSWGFDQSAFNYGFDIEYIHDIKYNFPICKYIKWDDKLINNACIKHYWNKIFLD